MSAAEPPVRATTTDPDEAPHVTVGLAAALDASASTKIATEARGARIPAIGRSLAARVRLPCRDVGVSAAMVMIPSYWQRSKRSASLGSRLRRFRSPVCTNSLRRSDQPSTTGTARLASPTGGDTGCEDVAVPHDLSRELGQLNVSPIRYVGVGDLERRDELIVHVGDKARD
jgi:hypothetical protein